MELDGEGFLTGVPIEDGVDGVNGVNGVVDVVGVCTKLNLNNGSKLLSLFASDLRRNW
ncbi:22621_t:CDS:2 [Entrophospora sp. SA101]|nr:22621_t:CDS:2 [Entrophospora sp. SA101]